MRSFALVLSASALLALSGAALAQKPETRCGWLSNPSPANVWLEDKDGEWTIGAQGGHQADGDWPSDFPKGQWIKGPGPADYGHGCACITATFDRKTMRVLAIASGKPRPLSACRNDAALKKREPAE